MELNKLLTLQVVSLITIVALIYLAINPNSLSSKDPSVVPTSNASVYQSCGTIPFRYLPDDVVYKIPFIPTSRIFMQSLENDSRIQIHRQPENNITTIDMITNITHYPWQAALSVEGRGFVCGASIILSKWIITAAHCMDIRDISKWTAYFGISALSQRFNGNVERRKIIRLLQDQNYFRSAFAYDYDIALLELDQDLPYSNFIQPICVPPQDYVFPNEMTCYISGWSLTAIGRRQQLGDVLQHAEINIIGNDICTRPDWLGELVTERMLCAGKIEGGRDSCLGDSGGPLSCYARMGDKEVWMIAGIVSWGIECGLPKFPGVYTKISFFTDWIWTNIAQAEGILPKNLTETDYEGSAHNYLVSNANDS